MISLIKNRLSILCVLLMSLQVCRSDVPNGTYTISFDAATAPVYDLSGPYNFINQIPGAGNQMLNLSYGAVMFQDTNGRLTGSGVTLLLLESEYLAASYEVKGKVQRSSGVTRVNFDIKLKGNQAVAGLPTKFSVSASYKLQIDPVRLVMTGTVRGNAKFNQIGSAPIKADMEIPLPPAVDGAWKLQATILPLENFAGTATFYIDNYTPADNPAGEPTDRILSGNLKGNYLENQDSSKLKITGTGGSKPTNLKLEVRPVAADAVEVLSMKGVILGQKVDYPDY